MLANVSWTGLAVLLEESYPVGTLFTLSLSLEDKPQDFTMEIIHLQKVSGDPRILHGCRFLDLSAGEEDHIQSTLIRHQMREANIREFGTGFETQNESFEL
ncbi:MAG: hypothetical protein CL927_03125 [Deltaproteobacteria bacterium]|nr:hypothetical protein [Deltaproteobacteria bacterium]